MTKHAAETGCITAGGVDICFGPGSIKNIGARAANFFRNSQYTQKVLQQMGGVDDLYHAFPTTVDNVAAEIGTVTRVVGGDGATYLRLQVDGAINGVKGAYTYIKDAAGNINHRLFEPY